MNRKPLYRRNTVIYYNSNARSITFHNTSGQTYIFTASVVELEHFLEFGGCAALGFTEYTVEGCDT